LKRLGSRITSQPFNYGSLTLKLVEVKSVALMTFANGLSIKKSNVLIRQAKSANHYRFKTNYFAGAVSAVLTDNEVFNCFNDVESVLKSSINKIWSRLISILSDGPCNSPPNLINLTSGFVAGANSPDLV
jgi:hypothetical protein